jgi:hypothetical protein
MTQGRLEDKKMWYVALMAHVLEACDLDTYANAHGRLEWENAMVEEYNSLMKNKTWDLVPFVRKECGEMSMGLQD